MRKYEPVAGIEGVASGGTATAKIPVNRRHLMLRIAAAAEIASVPTTDPLDIIERVTAMVRGKVIREQTAEQLAGIRQLNALPAAGRDELVEYFAEPWRAAVMDEVIPGWDTFGVENFMLKVKLKSGLTAPSLSVLDVYDGNVVTNEKGRARNIIKRTPFTFNLGSTGDIIALPLDLPIQRIFLQGESGKTIDAVKVTVNDTEVVHEMTAAENAAVLSDYGLDAGAFDYPILFDTEQQLFRRLEGIRSLAIRVHSSAAQSVTALVEQSAPDYI